MSIPAKTQMLRSLDKIEHRLNLINEYFAWMIHAEQRFNVGQRVEFSRLADDQGISKGRKKGVRTGTVKTIDDSFIIGVQLDGYKRPAGFHHSFFNPMRGPKLF